MEFSLQILETNDQITKSILKALLPDVTKYMNNGVSVVKSELPTIVGSAIRSSPEYDSILAGQLKYELGIVESANKLEGLISVWVSNLQIDYSPPAITGNQLKSKFSAQMIKADFSDVLGTGYAEMLDSERGYSLPWLRWLLLDGSQMIISSSSVSLGVNNRSRTGFAVMVPGGGWRVPPEFAGTQSDNWLTRAIQSASDNINNLLKKAFKS